MTEAQYAIEELKSKFGYSDGDIAMYAGISRQSVINIRHGRSSGKKVVGKLWSLKSLVNNSEDAPLPTPKQSTAEKFTADEEETPLEDDRGYFLDTAISAIPLIIVIVVVFGVALYTWQQNRKQKTVIPPPTAM